mgnify:CR=1 FL=1
MGLSLGLTQNQSLVLKAEVKQIKIKKNDYVWVNLGLVAYGIRNDKGEAQIHMSVGVRKDLGTKLPKELLEVKTKYFTFQLDGECVNSTPHQIDTVDYIKPKNLYGMIEMLKGKDKRAKVIVTDIEID